MDSPIPCPKCMRTDGLYIVVHTYIGDTGTPHCEYYVECDYCHYRGQPARTEQDAIKYWNNHQETRQ